MGEQIRTGLSLGNLKAVFHKLSLGSACRISGIRRKKQERCSSSNCSLVFPTTEIAYVICVLFMSSLLNRVKKCGDLGMNNS